MNQEMTWPDGMRGTIGFGWWRYDKNTGVLGESVFCRGEGARIVAGRFVGGEDVPIVAAVVRGLSPDGARKIGRAICRALYDAHCAGEC